MSNRLLVSAGLVLVTGLVAWWVLLPDSGPPAHSLDGAQAGPRGVTSPTDGSLSPIPRTLGPDPAVEPWNPDEAMITPGIGELPAGAAAAPSLQEEDYWKGREKLKRSAPPTKWDKLAQDPNYLSELMDPALEDLGLDLDALSDPNVLTENPELLEKWIEALVGPATEMLDPETLDLGNLPPEASQQTRELMEDLRQALLNRQDEPDNTDGEVTLPPTVPQP